MGSGVEQAGNTGKGEGRHEQAWGEAGGGETRTGVWGAASIFSGAPRQAAFTANFMSH